MGQISGKYRSKPGMKPNLPPSSTPKPARERELAALFFVFCSRSKNLAVRVCIPQKCKLLLHLGNSRAFSVDNNLRLSYDFLTALVLR
jgi:hypothetical protein